jgi:hypothetical protein
VVNRTIKGRFVKGESGNPAGRPKNPWPDHVPDPAAADRRFIPNIVVEARKYSALAIDTLVELTKDNHTDSTRHSAATALLDRGYGRPAQSLDLHLSMRQSDSLRQQATTRKPSACRRFALEIFFRLPRALPVPQKEGRR